MTGQVTIDEVPADLWSLQGEFLLPSNPTPKNDGSRRTRPVHTACRKSCRSETSSGRGAPRKGPPAKAAGSKGCRSMQGRRSDPGAARLKRISAKPFEGKPARSRRLAHHPYQTPPRRSGDTDRANHARASRPAETKAGSAISACRKSALRRSKGARSVVEIATVKPAFEGFFVSRDRAVTRAQSSHNTSYAN